MYDSDTLYVLIVDHCVILETLRIHCEIRETLRIHCVILEVLSICVWFWHIISTHCDPLCDSGDITYSLFDYGGIKYLWMIREWFVNDSEMSTIISTHCDPLCYSGDITYSLCDSGWIKYSCMIPTHYKYSLWSIVWLWWHYVFMVRFWRHYVFIVRFWRHYVFIVWLWMY